MKSIVTGTGVGTGAVITHSIGFVPEKVEVYNTEDAGTPILVWVKGMPNGRGIKILVGAQSLIANGGITPFEGSATQGAGFQIGADTDINVAGEDYVFVAYRGA